MEVKKVPTIRYPGQRPGTSGLRKKTAVFQQPHYLENFVQSVFDSLREDKSVQFPDEILVLGGDGRYYNRTAIQTILRMAAANGFGRVFVGRVGILSTPALSSIIRRHRALGGLLLTASHNPGGPYADFGIKYNIRNGGPAPEALTERIYARTLTITHYLTVEHPDIDLDREGSSVIGDAHVSIIDPLSDYTSVMEALFDFAELRNLFQSGFRMLFDAMHGVTGPYASHILGRCLGASEGTVIHGIPLEDFGGHHPDPNLVHAAELVKRMDAVDAPDLGAACDGDGDRNMILGKSFFVSPGDSLAIIAEHAKDCVPGYRGGLAGVARSMPTSTAVDRVAQKFEILCYETPTGWKFFGNLMDAGLCTICGEESFGTSSNHVREKDGLWAVLCWLSILANTKTSVARTVQDHWQRFGRSFFQRHDYEALDAGAAADMIAVFRKKLESLAGSSLAGSRVILTDDFSYTDPVDGSVSEHQGLRILLADNSRIVCRLSGTGTEGATLRLYIERYRTGGVNDPIESILGPLREAALQLLELRERCGRDRATVIT